MDRHQIALVMLRRVRPGGHPPVRERQRHAQPWVLALVALVEIQPDAESLQVGVRVRRQHEQESLHKILRKKSRRKRNRSRFRIVLRKASEQNLVGGADGTQLCFDARQRSVDRRFATLLNGIQNHKDYFLKWRKPTYRFLHLKPSDNFTLQ